MVRVLLIFLCLIASQPVTAAPVWVKQFPAAQQEAARKGSCVAVLVHGGAWQRASRRLLEDVWQTPDFRKALQQPVILTEIAIGQSLTKEEQQQQQEASKGWDSKTVRTFPAIQVYFPNGQLVKTIAGRELFAIADSPEQLATEVDTILRLARQRHELLVALQGTQRPAEDVIRDFDSLRKLTLDTQSADLELLKKMDPEDQLGLAGPLTFKGWNYIRDVTASLEDGVQDEELDAVEKMLANEHYTPDQKALIWCAKGMLLAASDKAEEAWQAYSEGHAVDPTGPNGQAVLRYGMRTVGQRLRVGPDPDNPVATRLTGGNLTANSGKLALSSADPGHNTPESHASLFQGELKEFAFHTQEEMGPFAVIDLGEVCRVEAVEVVNRHSNADRARDIGLWSSVDGVRWKPLWQATAVASQWVIDLTIQPDGAESARYLKLGLPPNRSGILHLRAVNAFGLRPGEKPRTIATSASPLSSLQTAITDERIQLVGLESVIRQAFEKSGKDLAERCQQESATINRYAAERMWRSRDGQTIVARLLTITPTEVTVNFKGQATVISRELFSTGSERLLKKVEDAARAIKAVVDEAATQQTES
jgi:hypothetical protein